MKAKDRAALLLALLAMTLMLAVNARTPEEAPAFAAAGLLAEREGFCLYAGEKPPDGAETHFDCGALWQGLLVYVGADTPLPADMPVQQARNVRKLVGLYIPAAAEVCLSEETIYALCDLVREDPLVKTWVMTGMRSPAEQAALQSAAFAAYRAVLPLEEALAQARSDVPDSGRSEHQLATAFDVRLDGAQDWSQADPMARTADGRWLLENGWRYGLIRRYPPEKREITGVASEGMHWRYVGGEHAAVMRAAGWCLEEYLDALHAYGSLRLAAPDGGQVWALCARMTETGASFPLPDGVQAAVSADNLGWAVCAFSLPADGG